MNVAKSGRVSAKWMKSPSFWVLLVALCAAWWAGRHGPRAWVVERAIMESAQVEEIVAADGEDAFLAPEDSELWSWAGMRLESSPVVERERVAARGDDGSMRHYMLTARSHRGVASFLPALVTILLCFLTRKPVVSLLAGVVVGGLLLRGDLMAGGAVAPGGVTGLAALMVLFYLACLGGLLGLWSRNGAAAAFAHAVTKRLVRGPRTAKLAAWGLGVAFFQGGSLSTLLVGTTVKPIADKENISHEELSYVVDSTSSPVAVLLPFNAWPFYVQGLIFVSGVGVLATEAGRVGFFFAAVPLSFYAMLAVGFTFLLSIDKLPFIGRGFREAIRRARETGQLDRPGARPLQSAMSGADAVQAGYRPAAWEFPLPLVLIVGIAAGAFVFAGAPALGWAFGAGLVVAYGVSISRGMPWRGLITGFKAGMGMVAYAAAILALAVTIGAISRATGGGLFLVELLDGRVAHWCLPFFLFLASGAIALATGSSWGTFAVVFPLAMPLAWAVAEGQELAHPLFFLKICFAAVLNGGVFGDQCSPISDTSVLSSLATGCDLMDHIRTQIVPCLMAGGIAVLGWTLLAVLT